MDTSLGPEFFFPYLLKSNLYSADPSIKRTQTPKLGHFVTRNLYLADIIQVILECIFAKLWDYRQLQIGFMS